MIEAFFVREVKSEGELPCVLLAWLLKVAKVWLFQIALDVRQIGILAHELFVLGQHADNLAVVVVRKTNSLEIELELNRVGNSTISLCVTKRSEVA